MILDQYGRPISSNRQESKPPTMMEMIAEVGERFVQVLKDGFGSEEGDENLQTAPRTDFDFGSAHYKFDILEHIPNDKIEKWVKEIREIEKGKRKNDAEGVIRRLIETETSLNCDLFNIGAYPISAREVIHTLLHKLIENKREKIALPVPNWHFWEATCDEINRRFCYFSATDEKELVENFAEMTKKRDVGVLILVNPANPLGYRISENTAKSIDKIAMRNGIEIIIDEVLRGVQPVGQRDSVARYFTRPYVVEGFSKRFGDDPCGDLTYVLHPKNERVLERPEEFKAKVAILIEVFKLALQYAAQPAIDELRRRNVAFDEGLRLYCPEGTEIRRPTETNLITIVKLPKDIPMSASELCRTAYEKGIITGGMFNYYPEGEGKKTRDMIRVTTGIMDVEGIRQGATLLGKEIRMVYETVKK